ncbi:glycoside hydrolase family 3 N-terminal domain-containing protein [Aestuariicoccus sp. MJ-SS9]|uniref:glycoside hydrolase family 3 N-terminal domain-containing protein n=1 Tax=Aestuariicoccus sp. MJ-SS9 TaxID=3079855 RepID=UPI0029158F79|nr:glycoside hydrolase family 3 N-terminal domain-containing protein [Aestuariicoccus sp. MJ-SS9]MDU8912671.1 glycoside hydrolase family 3 N-terminal domain-containing protein [Aestuariicoccus sp. MJ-SS9]
MSTARFGAAILGCAGPRLTSAERAFFAACQPFGFILFARNVEDADQLCALTSDLRDAVGWHAPIFIDQEGGRVQRLRPPLAREWPPPLDHAAALGEKAARGFYLRYRILATELMRYGIDGNCAPMLDIARPDTHPFLRNRCYGETLDQVVALGRATAQAHLDAGVLPVVKHMPGHGLGTLDSHLELPHIAEPRDALEALDFAAFKPFADLPLGMTAHLVFDRIDPDRPATVSPVMMRLIREDIGFGGLIMTDDISMEALSGTVPERGAAALAAGCDAVLHCNGDLEEMRALMDRVGQLDDAGQKRADAALARRPEPVEVDIDALADDLRALT